jgi:tetratricopeptide (TPR) repeat protein
MARLRADFGNDFQRARAEFLDYLASHPQGAFAGESWLRLAELEMKDRPERAVEYYGKFFATYPRHHRTSELQHRVGLLLLQLGRTDAAVEMLRRSLANVMSAVGSERKDVEASLARALKVQTADSAALEDAGSPRTR